LCEDPKNPGIISANTYKQLHTVTLKSFFECLFRKGLRENIDFVYNKEPKWYLSRFPKHQGILSLKKGGQVICISLDKFESSDGIEGAWAWNDESKDTKREAIEMLIERRRLNHLTGQQVFFTSTGKGKDHWLFDLFFTGKSNTQYIQGSTFENRKNLPNGYIEQLLEMYDGKQILEKVFGELIDYSGGSAYYTFSEKNIKSCKLDENKPLHIGIDFNVNPFCAVVCQFEDNTLVQPEEIYLENSNTFDMIKYINRKYKKWYMKNAIYIYPDPTGNKRQTSSHQTDIELLKNNGLNIMIKKKIIPIRDRLNIVNGKIKNSLGQLGYYVDPNCKFTIKDLNKVSIKDDGTIDGKKDKKLTHISDALGYLMYYFFSKEVLF